MLWFLSIFQNSKNLNNFIIKRKNTDEHAWSITLYDESSDRRLIHPIETYDI